MGQGDDELFSKKMTKEEKKAAAAAKKAERAAKKAEKGGGKKGKKKDAEGDEEKMSALEKAQLAAEAGGESDAMYFVLQSTDPKWRKENEFDVIVHYYESLIENGVNQTEYSLLECVYGYASSLWVELLKTGIGADDLSKAEKDATEKGSTRAFDFLLH